MDTKYRLLSRSDRALYEEILSRPDLRALSAEVQRLEDECSAVAERLAETPASTLAANHAKHHDSIDVGQRGRYLDNEIALSAVDDLARLVAAGVS